MLQEIIGRLNIPEGRKVYVLSGCLSLRELAAAIEGAKLFVGVDSAPMHIAAALDKSQIALFGASWVDKWRPYSEEAEVIYAGDYAELPHPDSIDTNDPTRLLKAIPLQDVWDRISAKLRRWRLKTAYHDPLNVLALRQNAHLERRPISSVPPFSPSVAMHGFQTA